MNPNSFHAPWSGILKLSTTLCILLILCCLVLMWISIPASQTTVKVLSAVVCGVIILVVALFAVRGYAIEGNDFVIYRPTRKTCYPISSIVKCWEDPQAMKGSWRIFGIGGIFVFAGLFRNKTLGSYYAYATDPQKAVVIKMTDRTIVVTPDSPSQLINQLNSILSKNSSFKS